MRRQNLNSTLLIRLRYQTGSTKPKRNFGKTFKVGMRKPLNPKEKLLLNYFPTFRLNNGIIPLKIPLSSKKQSLEPNRNRTRTGTQESRTRTEPEPKIFKRTEPKRTRVLLGSFWFFPIEFFLEFSLIFK